MKRIYFLAFALVIASASVFAQSVQVLKKVMEFQMPEGNEGYEGTRGASVAWHPGNKKYYASFAGNAQFPMAAFDEKGKLSGSNTLSTQADTRGLWYNPGTKTICGNGYDEIGWFTYLTDEQGAPGDIATLFEGMNQPNPHAAGVFNTAKKQVMFTNASQVYFYSTKGVLSDSMQIHWGRKKSEGPGADEDPQASNEDYNFTSLGYTGIKGQEYAFLNVTDKQIELYNAADGYLTKKLALPESQEVYSSFNFAYTNGMYFLFDQDKRSWTAYK